MDLDSTLAIIASDRPDGAVVLTVAGEIDRDSARHLRQAAHDAIRRGRPRLILDLGRVTFCDSSALSLLIDLHRRAHADGGWLRLAAPQAGLCSMLRVTHLDTMFAVYDSVHAAAQTGAVNREADRGSSSG